MVVGGERACGSAVDEAALDMEELVIAAASRWCNRVAIAASSCSWDQAAARSAYHSRASSVALVAIVTT